MTGSSSRSRAGGWRTCFRSCPISPATTSGCGGLAPQIARCISYLACDLAVLLRPAPAARLHPGAVRPVARDRAPLGARRAAPATATAAATAAASGASGSTCSARPTACRSALSWPPPTSANAIVAAEMLERDPDRRPHRDRRQGLRRRRVRGLMAEHGATFLRPDRKDEPRRYGFLGADPPMDRIGLLDLQGQLGLERHGARTLTGLCARVGLRLLALAAGIFHNHLTGNPARAFAAYRRATPAVQRAGNARRRRSGGRAARRPRRASRSPPARPGAAPRPARR